MMSCFGRLFRHAEHLGGAPSPQRRGRSALSRLDQVFNGDLLHRDRPNQGDRTREDTESDQDEGHGRMLGEADVVPPTEYQGPSASGQETKKGDGPTLDPPPFSVARSETDYMSPVGQALDTAQ